MNPIEELSYESDGELPRPKIYEERPDGELLQLSDGETITHMK